MQLSGILFALASALLWGLSPSVEKVGLTYATPLAGVAIRSITISLILIVAMGFTGSWREVTALDLKSAVYLALGGVLAGLCGQWTYFKALKSWEGSRVVPIAGTYPLVAMLLAVILLGEKLTWVKALGTALIVLGVWLIS